MISTSFEKTLSHRTYFVNIVSKFEDAAREMADEVTKPRPLGEEEVQDIQITLKSDANPMSVRELRVCNCQVISMAGTFYFHLQRKEHLLACHLLQFFDSLANQRAKNYDILIL